VRDFTKTQTPNNSQQTKTGALKCNACGIIVTAFGIEAGEPCRIPPENNEGACTGQMVKIDDATADRKKRQTDAAR
jgi:hypothetical protein